MNRPHLVPALACLALAACSLQAAAQSRFDVRVSNGALVVNKANDGSSADGAVWSLRTKGFVFSDRGVAISSSNGAQVCPPGGDRLSVSCKIRGFSPDVRFSYQLNVVPAAGSNAAPPSTDIFIVND